MEEGVGVGDPAHGGSDLHTDTDTVARPHGGDGGGIVCSLAALHKARPCKALFPGAALGIGIAIGLAASRQAPVLSPVTNLAINMVNLRGLGR